MLRMQNEKSGGAAPPLVEPSVGRPPSARPATGADEVKRLLLAGLQEIREKGSVEPRVADIVRRAGLSNKAFYRHFRSKDELLLAILEEGMRERVRTFGARLSEASSAADRVRVWIQLVLEQALNPDFAEVTRPLLVYQARLAEELGDQLWGHRDHLRAPLERALEEGRRSGEFRDLDPRRDAEVLFYLAMGWMHGMVLARVVPSQEEADNLVEFALRAILAPGPG
jgi:AcrR family transcriptional regulator